MPKRLSPVPIRVLSFLALYLALCSQVSARQDYSEYVGRYTDGADYAVYFVQTEYGMTLRPALWTATQLLKPAGKDRFVVVDRQERGATFHRDESGRVVAVTIVGMEGEGQKLVRAGRELIPVELFLSGKGREAARAYLSAGVKDAGRLIELAERVLSRFPTRAWAAADFLSEAANRFPQEARLYALLGYAQVWAGDRASALLSFRKAHSLEPSNKEALSGLVRLKALPAPESKEKALLPFRLSSVFKRPTPAEIRAVKANWRARDLRPRDVREVATGRINIGESGQMSVRIVSHMVRGSRHYGAIISPPNAKPGCCPVVVEAKGVSWNYFPLSLEKLHSPRLMGGLSQKVIYVVPSFRGEIMKFDGVDYQSEGDRTDAWDGATDDAIALLNVALQTTPAADASRICAFGHSRGGTVALLMGERDPRVRCVVDWAGPTDWFKLMGTEGWTQEELFAEGLRTRAAPSETGGQLVEHFLLKAVRGEEDLRAVRRRMLAGSPLYFARRLPRSQLHYGVEDPYVPIWNGLVLAAELNRLGATSRFSGYFYPGEGHDTDRIAAPPKTRGFLSNALRLKKGKD